jgi:hypothetical protein
MTKDTLLLRRIDHLRFFVGNARKSAYRRSHHINARITNVMI